MHFNLTHTRHDPSHCLAPGLFRSLKKGERKKTKLDVTYQHGDDSVRFVGFEPLGVDDMRLLQVLAAQGGPSGIVINLRHPSDGKPQMLAELMDPKFEAKKEKSIAIKTTLYSLIKELGYSEDDSRMRSKIIESLRRLSNVTVFVSKNSYEWSAHLLSFDIDKEDGNLYVAKNPRISNAILGKTSFTYISLYETRMLKTDAARLMHQRLSAVIDPGKKRHISLSKLIDYVWIGDLKKSGERMRRARARIALKEIEGTKAWVMQEVEKDLFLIKRKALKQEK